RSGPGPLYRACSDRGSGREPFAVAAGHLSQAGEMATTRFDPSPVGRGVVERLLGQFDPQHTVGQEVVGVEIAALNAVLALVDETHSECHDGSLPLSRPVRNQLTTSVGSRPWSLGERWGAASDGCEITMRRNGFARKTRSACDRDVDRSVTQTFHRTVVTGGVSPGDVPAGGHPGHGALRQRTRADAVDDHP